MHDRDAVEQRFPPGNNLFAENVGDDDAGEEDDDDSENQPETWNFCQKGGQLLRRKKDEKPVAEFNDAVENPDGEDQRDPEEEPRGDELFEHVCNENKSVRIRACYSGTIETHLLRPQGRNASRLCCSLVLGVGGRNPGMTGIEVRRSPALALQLETGGRQLFHKRVFPALRAFGQRLV